MSSECRRVREIVRRALDEDIGPGDVTTRAVIRDGARARASVVAKEGGVVAGMKAVAECFAQGAPDCEFVPQIDDGCSSCEGDVIAAVEGPVGQILTVERVALNFLQRLSGVATLTGRFVEAVADWDVRILDTRKTTPGLRVLQKAAVRAGGGHNHRFALYDGVILKDNHIRAAGGVEEAVKAARDTVAHTLRIEIEAETLAAVKEAVDAGADIIMLDNMDCRQMATAVDYIDGRALTEASGGITIETVADVAQTGVDFISVGSLTHSADAIDISLDITDLQD